MRISFKSPQLKGIRLLKKIESLPFNSMKREKLAQKCGYEDLNNFYDELRRARIEAKKDFTNN